MAEEDHIHQDSIDDEPAVSRALVRLVGIMRRLIAPGGCPWDQEQTHESLRPYLVEEVYEVLDAIDGGDSAELCSELGDVLLQVVFHAELARRDGRFSIAEVADSISEKLVRRHPHVFSTASASTAKEVEAQWDKVKKQEGAGTLSGVSRALPALRRAQQYGERVARIGFDWPDASGPRAKVAEELEELDQALLSGDAEAVEAELGDVMLAVSNVARHHGVEPEDALRAALDRFEGRFAAVEARLDADGRHPDACTLAELDALWNDAKSAERRGGKA